MNHLRHTLLAPPFRPDGVGSFTPRVPRALLKLAEEIPGGHASWNIAVGTAPAASHDNTTRRGSRLTWCWKREQVTSNMKGSAEIAQAIFLENPLVTARQLVKESGASIEDIRALFREWRNDDSLQEKLKTWGSASGYCIRVFQSVLQSPSRITSMCNNDSAVYPKSLELHLGPVCPCACTFCYSKGETCMSSGFSGYRSYPDSQLLTSENVISIINKLVGEGCASIYFSGGLEPFTNKVTLKVIRHLPTEPDVYIFTSGVPDVLNDEALELLVQRATWIRFSVHAASPTVYNMVQMPHRQDGEAIFRKVVQRVRQAVEIRNRLRALTCHASGIGVTFLTVPSNYKELLDAARMWAQVGIDRLDVGNDVLKDNSRTEHLDDLQLDEIGHIVEEIKSLADQGELNEMKVRLSRESIPYYLPHAQKCYSPLEKAVVDLYGNVWTCCMRAHPTLQNERFHLGMVRNGEDFQRLMQHRFSQPVSDRDIPLRFHCKECTEYEYTANVCIEKLIDDLRFGIDIADQPVKA